MSKKEKRNKIIFGLFIIFLMVSSTIGFMYSGESNTKKVNGYKFIRTETGWRTYIEPIESYWEFVYLPDEIGFDATRFNFNQDMNIYAQESDALYVDRLRFLLLYANVALEQVEELNCSDTKTTLVIERSNSDPEILTEGNCIYLKGNINKFIDGFTYRIFGVI